MTAIRKLILSALGHLPLSTQPPTCSRYKKIAIPFLAIAMCSLSGCNISAISDQHALPVLEGADLIRDTVVRTELATHQRAEQLAAKATECSDCSAALKNIADRSLVSANILGGPWKPWGNIAPEGAQQPQSSAEAPIEPQDFISWLTLTSIRDLHSLSNDDSITPEQAHTVATIVTGRLESASLLAKTYGVGILDGAERVNELNKELNNLQANDKKIDTESWNIPADAGTYLTDFPDSIDLTQSQQAALAIRTWDCVSQSLLPVYAKEHPNEGLQPQIQARIKVINQRVAHAVKNHAPDEREPRCRQVNHSISELNSMMLKADYDLIASSSLGVRTLGAAALSQDILATLSTTPDVVHTITAKITA